MYVHTHKYICTCIHTCIYVYVYTHLCMCICTMYICECIYEYITKSSTFWTFWNRLYTYKNILKYIYTVSTWVYSRDTWLLQYWETSQCHPPWEQAKWGKSRQWHQLVLKSTWHILAPCPDKGPSKMGAERNFLDLGKNMDKIPAANMMDSQWWKTECCPVRWETNRGVHS